MPDAAAHAALLPTDLAATFPSTATGHTRSCIRSRTCDEPWAPVRPARALFGEGGKECDHTAARAPAQGASVRKLLAEDGLQVASVIILEAVGQLAQLVGADEPHVIGDLLDAGNFEALARFDRLDVIGRLDQRFRRPGVEP